MRNVRQIRPDELAAFAAIGNRAEEAAVVQAYLEKMMKLGSIRIEWCYVLEEDGILCGRIAFWTMPKVGRPLAMVLVELPWDRQDYLSIGKAFLESTLSFMQAQGAEKIEYVLDTPAMVPQFQRSVEQRVSLLAHAGFRLDRETNRFEWNKDKRIAAAPDRSLTFRALSEVGDSAFIEAIMRVSHHTLDQRIHDEREHAGPWQHAANLFEELKEMEYDPTWWQLAFDEMDNLVGIVMPAKAPAFATIAYIGVVPERRGHGYIDPLLQQGTSILLAAGEALIRADTDVSNVPMAQAFLRAGYTQFCSRSEYSLELVPSH